MRGNPSARAECNRVPKPQVGGSSPPGGIELWRPARLLLPYRSPPARDASVQEGRESRPVLRVASSGLGVRKKLPALRTTRRLLGLPEHLPALRTTRRLLGLREHLPALRASRHSDDPSKQRCHAQVLPRRVGFVTRASPRSRSQRDTGDYASALRGNKGRDPAHDRDHHAARLHARRIPRDLRLRVARPSTHRPERSCACPRRRQ
jgi:hypothetical protein